MKKWNKNDAIRELEKLIKEIPNIKSKKRNSQEHIRWLTNSLRILEQIFGEKSIYYINLVNFKWYQSGNMIIDDCWNAEYEIEKRHQSAFVERMEQANGILLAAKDELVLSEIDEVFKGKPEKDEANDLIKILNIGEKKLRKLMRNIPSNEKEVQDKYEDLLIAGDYDYSREFPHIEYSSKKYIPDFSLAKINLAIEIKLCKTDEKKLIAEINDDILAYKTQFSNLIFVVYDIGQIRDIETFKTSFEYQDNVIIQVIKH